MISLIRPAPTLFLAASFTLYQVPQRRLSNLKERSLELMKTSFHSSVLSTEYCSTKPLSADTHKKTHYFCIHTVHNTFFSILLAPILPNFMTKVTLLPTRWQCQTSTSLYQQLLLEDGVAALHCHELPTNPKTGMALTEHLCK